MPMASLARTPFRLSLALAGGLALFGWDGPGQGHDPVPVALTQSGTTVDRLQVKVVTGTAGLSADQTATVTVLYFDRSRNSLRKVMRRLNVHPVKEHTGHTTVVRNESTALAPRSKQMLTIGLPSVQQPAAKSSAVLQPSTKPAMVPLRLSDLRQVDLIYGIVGPSMSGIVGPSMSPDAWDVVEIEITWSGHGAKGEAAHGTLFSRSGRPLHHFSMTGEAANWTTGTFSSYRGK